MDFKNKIIEELQEKNVVFVDFIKKQIVSTQYIIENLDNIFIFYTDFSYVKEELKNNYKFLFANFGKQCDEYHENVNFYSTYIKKMSFIYGDNEIYIYNMTLEYIAYREYVNNRIKYDLKEFENYLGQDKIDYDGNTSDETNSNSNSDIDY